MELKKETKKKGNSKPGPGRPKGVPNRATTEFRETVTRLLESNAENMSLWLEQVAVKNPYKALYLISQLAEFAAPKLSRTEVKTEHPEAIIHQITYRII